MFFFGSLCLHEISDPFKSRSVVFCKTLLRAARRIGCRIARQVLCILRRSADSRLPSSGICTRANYPSPPLKLRQNLLRRRIGAPKPPVLPVQQPGMPPSTAELVFKRRPRLERASLRYERRVPASSPFLTPFASPRAHPLSSDIPIPPSASRWNVNSPPPPSASPPRARPVSRIAIQRREDRLAVPQRKKEREKRAAEKRTDSESENGRTGARKQIRSARDGDGLIRGYAVEKGG